MYLTKRHRCYMVGYYGVEVDTASDVIGVMGLSGTPLAIDAPVLLDHDFVPPMRKLPTSVRCRLM